MTDAAIGHNAANMTPFEALETRYQELVRTGEEWRGLARLTSQEEADRCEAFRKQVRALLSEADKQRRAEKQPHESAAKAVDALWKPLIDRADRVVKTIGDMVTVFASEEKRRKQAEAAKAAEAARQREADARAAAQAAIETGRFADMDAAADTAREHAAAEAAAEAARQAAAHVRVGAGTVVDGRRRTATLREFESLVLEDITKAFLFLLASDVHMGDVADAVLKTARAHRKSHPEIEIPGVKIVTTEKIV